MSSRHPANARPHAPRIARRPLALALAGILASPLAMAQAVNELPTGPSGLVGINPGDIATVGNTMTIQQAGRGGVINWQTFSIGENATVDFNHAIAGGVTLNRVIGLNGQLSPSQIAGTLDAGNGRVFLVNPSGVVFGGTSRVSVGGLVASTLAIGDDAFQAGLDDGDRFAFQGGAFVPCNPIVTCQPSLVGVAAGAQVEATGGGTLALIGAGNVTNAGSMIADGGSVVLGQGSRITLDFAGDGLTQIVLDAQDNIANTTLSLRNDGLLQADGGQVVMASRSGSGTSGNFSIVQQGEMRARTLTQRAGRIVLSGPEAGLQVGGTLDATGGAGLAGGEITIGGDVVEITGRSTAQGCDDAQSACTRIDASGAAGGGDIDVGSRTATLVSGFAADGTSLAVELRADALASGQAGSIAITSDGPADVETANVALTGARVSATGFGTASGGNVRIAASQGAVALANLRSQSPAGVFADGASGGGSVELDAASALLVQNGVLLSANATGSGSGGLVRTRAGDLLDLREAQVSASGPGGNGRWEIESGRGLAIVETGDEDWEPLGVSLVDAATVSAALSGGTDVDILVPASANGFPQINVDADARIIHSGSGDAALSLRAAGGQIVAGLAPDNRTGAWAIESTGGGALDVSFDATSSVSLYGGAIATAGGDLSIRSRQSNDDGVLLQQSTIDSGGGAIEIDGGNAGSGATGGIATQIIGGTVSSNGGAIRIAGASSGGTGVSLLQTTVDSRVGADGTGVGGDITLLGAATGAQGGVGVSLIDSALQGGTGAIAVNGRFDGGAAAAGTGVSITGTTLATTSGAIAIAGRNASNGGGVIIAGGGTGGGPTPADSIRTTSGDIRISGIGSGTSAGFGGTGLRLSSYTITSGSGDIDLAGRGVGGGLFAEEGPDVGIGLFGGSVVSTGSGNVSLTGEARAPEPGLPNGAAGIEIAGANSFSAASRVQAGGNVRLRARSEAGEALRIGGQVAAQQRIDVRVGGVADDGSAVDDNGAALQVGGGDAFVSIASLANADSPDLVIGHADQAGAITVAEALARTGNLTLQNTGGNGGIAIDAATQAGGTLALVSAGDITQATAGTIDATALLARSTGGTVQLDGTGNAVATLAGGAAGAFAYRNTGALVIGDVTAVGATAPLSESGIGSNAAVLVRNGIGDLTLDANVTGTDVDLVTGGRLQNTAGATITAGNRWRVWADTWIGETRGGLAGSGALPNLFNCSFGGACGVDANVAGNHFIYRQQPTLTVAIDDASREYGLANAAFGFGVDGLVFADDVAANVVTGTPSTTATIGSNVGNYAITGSFASAAGYAVQVDAGTLAITPALLTYFADATRRLYGDPNGTLEGTVTGFRNGDTLGDLTGALQFVTDATAASDVGSYAINGIGLASGNYVFQQATGNQTALTIDPATLTYVANPLNLFFGQPFAGFDGSVTGFRNGDTLGDLDGTLAFSTTDAAATVPGVYPILGSGLASGNYVFTQAPSNFTALQVTTTPLAELPDMVRLPPETYVYSSNVGQIAMCAATGPLDDTRLDASADVLGREWSRVRSRPNLTSCVASDRKNSCNDF